MRLFAFAALLSGALAAAPARPGRHHKPDPRTVGLGRSCQKTTDCRDPRHQRCLHESDANGKNVRQGFCGLPCAPYESGTTQVVPGSEPTNESERQKMLQRKVPPRCPKGFLCRSAGAGVPLDLCVKQ